MSQTVEYCPLCGDGRCSHFDQRVFRGLEVFNHLCLNCGLIYQSPRMTEAEMEEFYAAEYRRVYQGDEGPVVKDLVVQRARARSLLAFAKKEIKTVSRHLDIGCSAGLLLQSFSEHYGTESIGVEPGKAYREYARNQGLTIYSSLEELYNSSQATFDLISMAHVLEHLPDPTGYLEALRTTRLGPDGYLLVEVPNLYGHDCFETAHLFSFSAHTLREVIRQAGYRIIRLEKHGRPRSEIVPYYISVLARPDNTFQPIPHILPERWVGLKRRLGMLRRRIANRLFPRKAWIDLTG
ncbi:MAG: class I SAM-dependent methyltransferase [Chloroflexota bacterium]